MNKYDISRNYWNSPIHILYNKSGNYVSHVIRNTQTSVTEMNHVN